MFKKNDFNEFLLNYIVLIYAHNNENFKFVIYFSIGIDKKNFKIQKLIACILHH